MRGLYKCGGGGTINFKFLKASTEPNPETMSKRNSTIQVLLQLETRLINIIKIPFVNVIFLNYVYFTIFLAIKNLH